MRSPGAAARSDAIARLGLLVTLLLGPILCAVAAQAAEPSFPPLTGRVVDAAGLLAPEAKASLEAKLKAYEDKTSDQVVVATIPRLQDRTVEDYANRLFRTWKLGQAKTNNGALLLVAPNERKVRIEVGYGLEGALTDALSKVIITTAIAPRFKAGDYAGGIDAGVDAMLAILSGDAAEWHHKAEVRRDEADPGQVVLFVVLFLVILVVVYRMNRGGRGRGGFVVIPGPSSGGWSGGVSGGFDGGGFSGGGFSGGGGSSGGGGASGDW